MEFKNDIPIKEDRDFIVDDGYNHDEDPVVITLSLLNFVEEYLILKRTLTTLIALRCTGNVPA